VRITFDTSVDALTIVLTDAEVDHTVDAGEGRFVDLDADGGIVALEVHSASQGLNVGDLADRFDLEPLFSQLRSQVRQARDGIARDPVLREVLAR
jgi:uncharacterized protein YuzE